MHHLSRRRLSLRSPRNRKHNRNHARTPGGLVLSLIAQSHRLVHATRHRRARCTGCGDADPVCLAASLPAPAVVPSLPAAVPSTAWRPSSSRPRCRPGCWGCRRRGSTRRCWWPWCAGGATVGRVQGGCQLDDGASASGDPGAVASSSVARCGGSATRWTRRSVVRKPRSVTSRWRAGGSSARSCRTGRRATVRQGAPPERSRGLGQAPPAPVGRVA